MAIAAINDLRIVVGGQRALEEGIALAGRAHTSLSGEFFAMVDDPARAAVRSAWVDRGIPGSAVITAHPQSIQQLESIAGRGTTIAQFGDLAPSTAPRQFIHSKTLARDTNSDPEAWLSTGSFGADTRGRWDLAALFGGDPARAVHELADSVTSHDWQRQRDAIQWARGMGIYVVDPVSNERGLATAVTQLVRDEPTRLTVAIKSMFDPEFAGELAARHARDGIPVEVITKRIDEPSERILREAGVTLLKPDPSLPEIHGNMVHAEGLGQAYMGTMWASPRGFGRAEVPNPFAGGGATLPRSQWWDRSREIGLVTSDPQGVHDLRAGVEQLRPAPHDFAPEVIRVAGR